MVDELLPYYQRELTYIRRQAGVFADRYPQEAGRLGIRTGAADDPHVERLMEAFAYLTARIRRKLDDDFPELTDGLLNVLYPHYLSPLPSAAIVQFVLDESQGELATGYRIERGEPVEMTANSDISCKYRTAYETTLWPIQVMHGELLRRPFSAPEIGDSGDAVSMIRIQLKCRSAAMKFGGFDAAMFDPLRFFLQAEDHHAMPLYELLFNHVVQVVVAQSPADASATILPRDCLRPVGFAANQQLFPSSPRSFPGYTLLTEYFTFPWKFLFFDVHHVLKYPKASAAGSLDLFVYLDRETPELEKYVSAGTFRLGCTPIVNLYKTQAEPVRLKPHIPEHPVMPDARNPIAHEVYSVDRVRTTSNRDKPVVYQPLFGCNYANATEGVDSAYWISHRRPARNAVGEAIQGSDVFLSLVDRELRLSESISTDETLVVDLTCFNRDLPNDLKGPRAILSNGGPLRSVDIWKGPTRTLRPPRRERGLWSLISHLSLNHLSLGDVVDTAGQADGGGGAALRSILELYDFQGSKGNRQKIRGVTAVTNRAVVDRLPGSPSGFARGTEVSIEFDEERFRDQSLGLFLFAAVLEQFLAMYASINSFTKCRAVVAPDNKVLKEWPPNTGQQFVI